MQDERVRMVVPSVLHVAQVREEIQSNSPANVSFFEMFVVSPPAFASAPNPYVQADSFKVSPNACDDAAHAMWGAIQVPGDLAN